ncbi:hypothetical protein [Paenibacillus xylaniclasticus]|uniref:hypothetical protein n=1 Tax=Paenibacillus xylaniclasticus TaxID=588083 RepID=UPI000FD99E8C|nr:MULTISPECIES: hypothetical protein [Paenibacillus]
MVGKPEAAAVNGFPRYVGANADVGYSDGRLRPVKGVHHYQIVRAHRERTGAGGWTFHHNPLLAYWNHMFLLQYITCPVEENRPPSQTMLIRSHNGIDWTEPVTLFPPYPIVIEGVYRDEAGRAADAGSFAMMHQRTGFYTTQAERMLCLGFYGITPRPEVMPNDGKGIGRVVRELYRDGRLGPIYFIRYNRHAGWNETNTSYPHYTESDDKGFIEACEELLADRLATLAWWEEDRSQDGMYTLVNVKAPVHYQLPSGKVVVFGKWSQVAVSDDDGMSWNGPRTETSIVMAGSKLWAQRLRNGKYIAAYNPNPSNEQRWPLAISVSDDGLVFRGIDLLCGDVPVRRYAGQHKYRGMNYVSGITEGNGDPPGDSIWLTFSMNKEDLWVSKIPLVMETEETEPLDERFCLPPEQVLSNWQLYRPLWAQFLLAASPDEQNQSLQMSNADPYCHATAERAFPKCTKGRVKLGLLAAQDTFGQLQVVLMAGNGAEIGRLRFNPDGRLIAYHASGQAELMRYAANQWYNLVITFDLGRGSYGVEVAEAEGCSIVELACLASAHAAERIAFQVGGQWHDMQLVDDGADVPDDRRERECTYYLHYVKVVPDIEYT